MKSRNWSEWKYVEVWVSLSLSHVFVLVRPLGSCSKNLSKFLFLSHDLPLHHVPVKKKEVEEEEKKEEEVEGEEEEEKGREQIERKTEERQRPATDSS